MKRSITWLLVLVLVLGLSSVGTSALAGEQQNLLLWVSGSIVSHTDQKLPQEEWTISKIIADFEEENPDVAIELMLFPTQITMMQTFKAAAAGDDSPDIVNVWTGQQLFEMKDIVADLRELIPQEDMDHILGWDTVTLDFVDGNPILAYPASGNETCGFLYNKLILAECGLDYDTDPPKTLERFLADMETIKAAGYLPIAAADAGWGQAFYTAYASWWVQSSGSAMVASDSRGITKFADDQGFLRAVQTAADLYEQGYVNVDYSTISSAVELFAAGSSALLATGNWDTNVACEALGVDNVGYLNPPDIAADVLHTDTLIGGPGQALVVSENCKNKELAVKFLSFLSNKENMISILKSQSKLPLRDDISAEDLGYGDSGVMFQQYEASLRYVFWADNSMVPDVNSELQKLSPLVLTGKMSVEEFAARLDEKAAEVAGQ